MWDRLSFRFKITVIFSVSLFILTLSLTALSLMNAQQNISNPMKMSIMHFEGIADIMLIDSDGDFIIAPPSNQVQGQEDFRNFYISEEEINQLLQEHGGAVSHFPIGQLQAQLSSTQRDFRLYSFWVAGVIIILGSLGAYLAAGVVMGPIKKLSASVEGVEAEKLDVSLPLPKSRDEISQLTLNFNKMLDKLHRSFESKQLFAQNAAHELKTPLTIIRAHLQALDMDDAPTKSDYEEVFSEVKSSTERMIGLVEGLLAMGKSPDEADMTVFQGAEIFETIFCDLRDIIESKHLNVQIIGTLTIKGQKTLLSQGFFNLVHNAARYNVDGGNIVVTMSQGQITIEDTGIGIPSELLGHVFDPFYCVDKSRSKKLGGNGLGLAIAKNIFDVHQMSIQVTSEVGVGTLVAIQI
ncbi:MAG: HAMP domain-containing histidine kinase [Defluviitaleaceae bacterium]|nr:HAMP domain-containing histidine kinase [Defluviitaleaceae bacterium]